MTTTDRTPAGGLRRLNVVITVLGVCLFAAFSIHLKMRLRPKGSDLAQLPVGKPVPEFKLRDLQGKEYDIAKITAENQVVLIDFWASWCGPCRIEMPSLKALYAKDQKRGLVILAIDEDDDLSKMELYLKAKPVNFPILLDPGQALAKRLGIEAFPTTILVGPKGRIGRVIEGVEQYLSLEVDAMLSVDAKGKTVEGPGVSMTFETTEAEPKEDPKK